MATFECHIRLCQLLTESTESLNIALSKCSSNFLEQFHILKQKIDSFVAKFESKDYATRNWMFVNDSEGFNELRKEFNTLCEASQLVDFKISDGKFKRAKISDADDLKILVENDLRNYESLRHEEARRLNKEIRSSIEHLRAGGADAANNIKLRRVNKSFLTKKINPLSSIGKGTFGYVCGDTLRGVNVAIKSLNYLEGLDELTEDQKVELWKEAVALQVHQLPGVIRFYGVDDADAPTMIVMEAAICSLTDWLYKPSFREQLNELTYELKLQLLYECAGTFAFLHSVGVVHRDIKPSNILIMNREGRIKVTDFGCSLHSLNEVQSTNNGVSSTSSQSNALQMSRGTTVRGTTPYMAPELMIYPDSGTYVYSEATDVYAFGIMINEVHTERKPFDNIEDLTSLMYRTEGHVRPSSMEGTKEDDFFNSLYSFCCYSNIKLRRPFSFLYYLLYQGLRHHTGVAVSASRCEIVHVSDLLVASAAQTGYYTGDIRGNVLHGKGTLRSLNGDVYTGYWLNSNKEGYGDSKTTKGSYSGQWTSNAFNGTGLMTYKGGRTYKGRWKAGLRCGEGTMTYPGGSTYVGQWRDNLFDGKGILTVVVASDIDVKEYFDETDEYGGTWNIGVTDDSTTQYKAGEVYNCTWHEGLLHGSGTIKYANGDVFIGLWNLGKLVDGKLSICQNV